MLRDLAEPRRAADAVREDLEKLQGEHADLKARLAKIEARFATDVAAPPDKKGGPAAAAKKSAKESASTRRRKA